MFAAREAFRRVCRARDLLVDPTTERDLDAEHRRLSAKGVAFVREPTTMGPVRIAVFSDTCGNLIQLYQPVV